MVILPRTPGSMIKFFPVNSEIALITSVISTFGKSKDSMVAGKLSLVISSRPALANLSCCFLLRLECLSFAPPPKEGPSLRTPESPAPTLEGVAGVEGGGGGGGKPLILGGGGIGGGGGKFWARVICDDRIDAILRAVFFLNFILIH